MNDLYSFFIQGRNQRRIDKWHHYFEIYERHLARLRPSGPAMLEIGVQGGGSIEMWRQYFGTAARIYGIDHNQAALRHEDIATRIFIGDQADRVFLRGVLDQTAPLDLVIDDGGHSANQQITSFEEIYPTLSENGIYLVEDTHTSLWGGTFMDRADRQSFLQFAFARCAELMDWTGRFANFQALGDRESAQALEASASLFCRTTKSIHFYDSVIVFERGRRQVPVRATR
jgi:hypothetical protein